MLGHMRTDLFVVLLKFCNLPDEAYLSSRHTLGRIVNARGVVFPQDVHCVPHEVEDVERPQRPGVTDRPFMSFMKVFVLNLAQIDVPQTLEKVGPPNFVL